MRIGPPSSKSLENAHEMGCGALNSTGLAKDCAKSRFPPDEGALAAGIAVAPMRKIAVRPAVGAFGIPVHTADSQPSQPPASQQRKVRHEAAPLIAFECIGILRIQPQECLAHLRADFEMPRPDCRP